MRLFGLTPFFRGLAATVVATLTLAGCHEAKSPTEPLTSPTAPAATVWDNTVRTSAVTDPANCLGGGSIVGAVYVTTFELQRSGNSVVFVPPSLDFSTYTGTVNGANFTAMTPAEGASWPPCGDSLFTGSLSGSFSEDGRHLTATEIVTYTWKTGQVSTIMSSWSATRR